MRTTHRSIALWALFLSLVCLCPPQDFGETLALVAGPHFFETTRHWQGFAITVPWQSQLAPGGAFGHWGAPGVALLRVLCCLGFLAPLWISFDKNWSRLQGGLCWLLGSCFPLVALGRFHSEALCAVGGALLMASVAPRGPYAQVRHTWGAPLAWGLLLVWGGWALVWPGVCVLWVLAGPKKLRWRRWAPVARAALGGLILYALVRTWETRGSPTPFWDWQRYDWFSYVSSWHDSPITPGARGPLLLGGAVPLGAALMALVRGPLRELAPYGLWVALQVWSALGSAQPVLHVLPALGALMFLCGHCGRGPGPEPWALANLFVGLLIPLGLVCLPWAVALGARLPEPWLLLAEGFEQLPNPLPTWLVFGSICLFGAGFVAWSRGRWAAAMSVQMGLGAVAFGAVALAQFQYQSGVVRTLGALCPRGPVTTVGLLAPLWDWEGQKVGCAVSQRPRDPLVWQPPPGGTVVPWWDSLSCHSLGYAKRVPMDPYVLCLEPR